MASGPITEPSSTMASSREQIPAVAATSSNELSARCITTPAPSNISAQHAIKHETTDLPAPQLTTMATTQVSGVGVSGNASSVPQPGSSSKFAEGEFNPNNLMEQKQMLAVMEFLKAKKLTSVVEMMKCELGVGGGVDEAGSHFRSQPAGGGEVGKASRPVSLVRAEANIYLGAYAEYKQFVEQTLEMYQAELGSISYPLFVYMYMDLINQGSVQDATIFCSKYMSGLDTCYGEYLRILSSLKRKEFLVKWDYLESFRSNNYVVSVSSDAFNYLKRYVHNSNYHGLMRNILNERLKIDTYDGAPRSKQQIATARGAMAGDALKEINKTKVYYGLIKEPDFDVPIFDDDEDDGKQKKKRVRRDLNKKSKPDANAPSANRIPLPELRHIDKLLIMHARREAKKRMSLGGNNLPSICFYTILNAAEQALCVEVSDDAALLAVGFADSYIKLYSLTPEKLRVMKGVEELSMIDKECDADIFRRMMEESRSTCETLLGHQGAVYGLSFSPDIAYLLSCSCDSSIRLWSLNTFTCLVAYTSHCHPVLDVCFSPHGSYFLSCSRDKTARLWRQDTYHPVRMFVGHFAAVLCGAYHPNSNYVATGSADRSVRVWDVLTGCCVRHYTGHKAPVSCLRFHTEGRYLVSAGSDGVLMVWDLDCAALVAVCSYLPASPTGVPTTPGAGDGAVSCLALSRDGTLLVSGGLRYNICVWDMANVMRDYQGTAGRPGAGGEGATTAQPPPAAAGVSSMPGETQYVTQPLKAFRTKQSAMLLAYFTRRNLMLAFGKFDAAVQPQPS